MSESKKQVDVIIIIRLDDQLKEQLPSADITANVNGIWSADDPSFFVNPTVNFNLSGNTEFLLAAQLFGGTSVSTFGKVGSYVLTRLKWSF